MLYIFWLLHQTTTPTVTSLSNWCCISFDSYIKPQPASSCASSIVVVYLLTPTSNHNRYQIIILVHKVVYLLTPTSNHNFLMVLTYSSVLYIFWLLHQTTTSVLKFLPVIGCISFDSYIKPQLWGMAAVAATVVYLLTPTSNHNSNPQFNANTSLYIFWLLHQTTTRDFKCFGRCLLYIFWLLHQTTTHIRTNYKTFTLYIFWLLHQTTTFKLSCASSTSLYIFWLLHQTTTNRMPQGNNNKLYIFWLLHQTTTSTVLFCFYSKLYIFWLLHQTTTWQAYCPTQQSCISFDSYIKPQRCGNMVVILLSCISFDSYIKPQLWILILTPGTRCISFDSYIKPQRLRNPAFSGTSCISFDSYIKPQLMFDPTCAEWVVYLLTPTSNHNSSSQLPK